MWISQHKIKMLLFGVGMILFVNGCSDSTSNPKKITKVQLMQDAATRDTPLETLKTLTAEISAVEQQNQAIIAQNKALSEQDKKTLAQFKVDMQDEIQRQMNEIKKAKEAQDEKAQKLTEQNYNVPRHNGMAEETPESSDALTWIRDLQTVNQLTDKEQLHQLNSLSDQKMSMSEEKIKTAIKINKPPVPYYTIPVNATLTGAVAMQPIIGRIPIDGKVTDPYAFKVIIGPKIWLPME